MNLNALEQRLKTLVELHLSIVMPGYHPQEQAFQKIAEAMQKGIQTYEGKPIAPNVYTLLLPREEFAAWKEKRLLDAFLEAIKRVAEEQGLAFSAPPTLTLSEDPSLGYGEMRVIASHSIEKMGETQGMEEKATEPEPNIPPNAFLILEGSKVFPLTQSVINIGRRLDNHIVIDDPRVSRRHAQLRAVKGWYILFDLNSTGGTFVNGQRVTQSILYPGDVISLAGVSLIYGQDNPPPRQDLIDTKPLSPNTAERKTIVWKKSP